VCPLFTGEVVVTGYHGAVLAVDERESWFTSGKVSLVDKVYRKLFFQIAAPLTAYYFLYSSIIIIYMLLFFQISSSC
jgi:hypothetical protein